MSLEADVTLAVDNLSVSYGHAGARKGALHDATFALRRGEAVGVIGETGAGKSSLARAVLGLVKPVAGTIEIAGVRVSALSPRALQAFRRRGLVQYVFQDPLRSLDPELTVLESIAEPLRIQARLNGPEIERAVLAQIERVKLDPELGRRYPGELSGGQRQRVAIARALITEPALLILDEPVSALDSAHRRRVLELLLSLRSAGTALLFISHDLGSVAGLCDRIIVLCEGRIVESGATEAIVRRPAHPYTARLIRSAPSLSRARA